MPFKAFLKYIQYLNLSSSVRSLDVVLDHKLQGVLALEPLLQLFQLRPELDVGPPTLPVHVRALGSVHLAVRGRRDLVSPEGGHVQVGQIPIFQNIDLRRGESKQKACKSLCQ
jgi:hypothetical protein